MRTLFRSPISPEAFHGRLTDFETSIPLASDAITYCIDAPERIPCGFDSAAPRPFARLLPPSIRREDAFAT